MARNPTGKPIASTYICSYRWEEGEPKDYLLVEDSPVHWHKNALNVTMF